MHRIIIFLKMQKNEQIFEISNEKSLDNIAPALKK